MGWKGQTSVGKELLKIFNLVLNMNADSGEEQSI